MSSLDILRNMYDNFQICSNIWAKYGPYCPYSFRLSLEKYCRNFALQQATYRPFCSKSGCKGSVHAKSIALCLHEASDSMSLLIGCKCVLVHPAQKKPRQHNLAKVLLLVGI